MNTRTTCVPAVMLAMMLTTASLAAADPAPLPRGITSIGGIASGSTLYVYGGNAGPAHEYSIQNQSRKFLALDLSNPTSWKTLPSGPRLQGLALAAYDGKIYRLGGFTATNKKGEDQNLQSQAGVAVYDPAETSWRKLTDLPEPRSSFDSAVLGSRIYVVGGWDLGGGPGSGHWHKTAWSADLSQSPLVWEKIASPPFQRRAVAVEAYAGQIYVIGGMGDDGTTRRVDVYDPESNTWRRGPDLAGDQGMDGFGPAAIGTDSGLYVSSLSGDVQKLTEGAENWQVIAEMPSPRFFHQMVAHNGQLWLVGGANQVEGKLRDVDVIDLRQAVSSEPAE